MNINDYIGIPWVAGGRTRDAIDCWGLCAMVYRDQLGIDLIVSEFSDELEAHEIEGPEDMCLVRGVNMTNQADHWGIYYKGAVLNADRPHSCAPTFKRFVQRWPCVEFYRIATDD